MVEEKRKAEDNDKDNEEHSSKKLKPDEADAFNKQTNQNTQESSQNGSANNAPSTPSSTPLNSAQEQIISLTAGNIYKVSSRTLGEFHFEAGHSGSFQVAGQITISDLQGNILLTKTDSSGEVVKVEEQNGTTALTASLPPAPASNQSNWSISSWLFPKLPPPPIQIVARENEVIVLNGDQSAVITGNGGILSYNGSGVVTVEGRLNGLWNNSTGTVRVNGGVRGGVTQTGRGRVVINGFVDGGQVLNSGGGSVSLKGSLLNNATIVNRNGLVCHNYNFDINFQFRV